MPHFLDVELDVTALGHEIKMVPVRLKLSDQASALVEQGISLVDMADNTPGDDAIDVRGDLKAPVFKVFGKSITVDLPYTIKIHEESVGS